MGVSPWHRLVFLRLLFLASSSRFGIKATLAFSPSVPLTSFKDVISSDTSFLHRNRGLSCLSASFGSLGCRPIGIGSSVPPTIITNADLEAVVETTDEWISTRTGIRQRHVLVGSDESLQQLGAIAGKQALEMANIQPEDIDLVLCATSTPDDMFGDATSIAAKLGCKNAFGFDLTAACSGFLFGIVTAGQFLTNGSMKNVLVVGADSLSRWVDWDDRNSCILFGDGAGAVVLTQDHESPGVLGYAAHSNGLGHDDLKLS
jgi:3-oxoacyl-[acyl-carrier-protein] synthase III